MSNFKQRLTVPAVASILLHSAFVGLLFSEWGLTACIGKASLQLAIEDSEPVEIVHAHAVSQEQIDAIYEHNREVKRKIAEEIARKEAERKAAEEAARKEAERKAAEEAARKEAERKAAEEAARKEAERKAAEEVARKEFERKEAERKAAEEVARKEFERKEAERKAAEEVARKEFERKEAERKAAEEAARKRHQKQLAVWKRQYIQAIRQSIERKWKKPPASIKGGRCVVRLTQDESGNISSVKVVSCEGDQFYRRSVEDAVWKAAPLPKPPSREVFDNNVEIIFKQEY